MQTETFVQTRKIRKTNHIVSTTVKVDRTPKSLSESRMRQDRWYLYVRDHITGSNEVTVTINPTANLANPDTFFEVVTPHGVGCVIRFRGSLSRTGEQLYTEEMMAFIPNSGPALIQGCWKKYNFYRGHAVAWMMAHRLDVNSRAKVTHTCAQAIYDAARGFSRIG